LVGEDCNKLKPVPEMWKRSPRAGRKDLGKWIPVWGVEREVPIEEVCVKMGRVWRVKRRVESDP
jgi:hypothetical protein